MIVNIKNHLRLSVRLHCPGHLHRVHHQFQTYAFSENLCFLRENTNLAQS